MRQNGVCVHCTCMTDYKTILVASAIALAMAACGNAATADPDTNATPTSMSYMDADATLAKAWEGVLAKRLSQPEAGTGLIRFDYKGFSESEAEMAVLDRYIAELANQSEPSDPADAAAYWANLYNAVTVDVVADEYPVDSIRDIKSGVFKPGPWDKELVTVNGEELTLNNIEHDILRKRYASPHVHYMVNCASVGCPNLLPDLWDGATLEADREAAARAFINSPRGVKIEDGKTTVSSIYSWFQEDFGGSKSGVIDHIREYADADLKAALGGATKYDRHDYDWSLNGQ